MCVTSAVLIGLAFYLFGGLRFYGGLSGVVSAAVAYLCLQGVTEKGPWRWLCAAMFRGLATKLWFKLMLGKSRLLAVGNEALACRCS